jgi:uncharacterized protein (TIGR02246 family)
MTRVLSVCVTALVLLAAGALPAAAQQRADDEAAVRRTLAAYADARNVRDAAAEARAYAPDGDFRSSLGPFVTGRAEIEKQLTVTNAAYRFALTVTRLRFLSPEIAIADAEVNAGLEGRQARLVGTYVMSRSGAEWLIAAARIATAPQPRPAAATP